MTAQLTITFIGRKNCHLCDAALPIVRSVVTDVNTSRGLDWTVEVVDVDSDPELLDRYDWEVPVVLINGRQHSFHRVTPGRLQAALLAASATRFRTPTPH